MKLMLGVAINEYENSEDNLSGCVNDWNLFKKTAIDLGFPKSYIRQVTDRRATKKAILDRLQKYTAILEEGDTFIFFYSGHGAQVRNGLASDNELDNLDEVILPTDYSYNNLLYDDEIYQVISSLPKGLNFIYVTDSCYSETQYRFIQPSNKIDCVSKSRGTFILNYNKPILIEHRCNLYTFSASRDTEPALEVRWNSGIYRGLFTTLFCKNIIQYKDLNVKQIEQQVNSSIQAYEMSQRCVISSPELVTFKELMNG